MPKLGLGKREYDAEKEVIYQTVKADYESGETTVTIKEEDITKPSAISYSFLVEGDKLKPMRLMHVYDIAGEVFTSVHANEVQKQYDYSHGIVLVIDPLSITEFADKIWDGLSPIDKASASDADIMLIMDSFLQNMMLATGLTESQISSIPLAVVISKSDCAGLPDIIGESAVNREAANPAYSGWERSDIMDSLCRDFLKNNGMAAFELAIRRRFKVNRFFSCSAIGHERGAGAYAPSGVLRVMEWIVSMADPALAKIWKNENFPETPRGSK
jgi:hypothetical protein